MKPSWERLGGWAEGLGLYPVRTGRDPSCLRAGRTPVFGFFLKALRQPLLAQGSPAPASLSGLFLLVPARESLSGWVKLCPRFLVSEGQMNEMGVKEGASGGGRDFR